MCSGCYAPLSTRGRLLFSICFRVLGTNGSISRHQWTFLHQNIGYTANNEQPSSGPRYLIFEALQCLLLLLGDSLKFSQGRTFCGFASNLALETPTVFSSVPSTKTCLDCLNLLCMELVSFLSLSCCDTAWALTLVLALCCLGHDVITRNLRQTNLFA